MIGTLPRTSGAVIIVICASHASVSRRPRSSQPSECVFTFTLKLRSTSVAPRIEALTIVAKFPFI